MELEVQEDKIKVMNMKDDQTDVLTGTNLADQVTRKSPKTVASAKD